jgi:hypothetical protein
MEAAGIEPAKRPRAVAISEADILIVWLDRDDARP